MLSKVFYNLGAICSVKQWEVIFSILTISTAMLSFVNWDKDGINYAFSEEYQGLHVIAMLILKFLAFLLTFKQIKTIYQIGSNFILGFTILLVFLSSFVYFCSVMLLFNINIVEIRESFFIFFLLIDLEKATYILQCALKSSGYSEVKKNIADAISNIGPSMTLHSVSLTLMICFGVSSDITRVAQLCGYGVLAIIVHYISIITICPSCISLALELLTRCSASEPPWLFQRVSHRPEATTSNPVIQGVKKIMSGFLFILHGIKWFSGRPVAVEDILKIDQPSNIFRWINAEAENIVLFVMVIALVAYCKMRESTDDLIEMDKQKGSHSSISVSTQTEVEESVLNLIEVEGTSEVFTEPRTAEECLQIYKSEKSGELLTDEEVGLLLRKDMIPHRCLEDALSDCSRAVTVRRNFIKERILLSEALNNLPFRNYEYSKVKGCCCENVIGYVPIPVGIVGPIRVDEIDYFVPVATTEGALVASTNRGCKALSVKGVKTKIYRDGMTRAPMIQLPCTTRAVEVLQWINMSDNFALLKKAFDSTSRFARLTNVHVFRAHRVLCIRFVATTGDAMGMNMVSKGAEAALVVLKEHHKDVVILLISSNLCTDKKQSAVNWLYGRGKSVCCSAVIPGHVVKSVLKTDVVKLVQSNNYKNYMGSVMAASMGGNNCHAANIVAAIFIACGQDVAQVVESSMCMTTMEVTNEEDLDITVDMPSLEVGTVGGGTGLPAQVACLKMLGVQGPATNSGDNARKLAGIIAATVMAAEISLLASLTEQSLVKSHLALNRKKE